MCRDVFSKFDIGVARNSRGRWNLGHTERASREWFLKVILLLTVYIFCSTTHFLSLLPLICVRKLNCIFYNDLFCGCLLLMLSHCCTVFFDSKHKWINFKQQRGNILKEITAERQYFKHILTEITEAEVKKAKVVLVIAQAKRLKFFA